MNVIFNGEECNLLPDETVCKLTDQHPFDMQECPLINSYCNSDCIYYSEWGDHTNA